LFKDIFTGAGFGLDPKENFILVAVISLSFSLDDSSNFLLIGFDFIEGSSSKKQ